MGRLERHLKPQAVRTALAKMAERERILDALNADIAMRRRSEPEGRSLDELEPS